jgi:hypothetical protein
VERNCTYERFESVQYLNGAFWNQSSNYNRAFWNQSSNYNIAPLERNCTYGKELHVLVNAFWNQSSNYNIAMLERKHIGGVLRSTVSYP